MASATQKTATTLETQLKTVNFNYDPKTTVTAGSAGIGMVLVSPAFEQKVFRYFNERPFTDFKKSLENDLQEMITSRGFTFRGPFNGYDEITYIDKKATDIVIEVEIIPSLQFLSNSPWKSESHYNFRPYGASYYTYTYSYESKWSLSGKIKITFSEILSHEKINIRNIEINEVVFDVKSEKKYSDNNYIPLRDAGIFNPLVTALEEIYSSSLAKTWNFFDPEEIKSWMPQIKELREKKRY
jgi:hypothetical protein